MFQCTFLERENIIKSRTGLHLSLHGLDVKIMVIKASVKQTEIAIRFLAYDWSIMCQTYGNPWQEIYFCLRQISRYEICGSSIFDRHYLVI